MLFAYTPPTAATNWFHQCMAATLAEVHRLADGNRRLPAWPNIAPVAYHAQLRLKTGLRNRFKAYYSALKKLSPAERKDVLETFSSQNAIETILDRTSVCDPIGKLPESIQAPTSDLFDFAFKQLEPLNIRYDHYDAICKPLKHSICPFCGYESIDDAAEPLDHYLALSLYPFAGVNLRNLPFMGHKCNSKYKTTTDMIWNGKSRRQVFDPYCTAPRKLELSLLKSVPFGGADGETPKWEIEFLPHSTEVDTWFEVFEIKSRYTEHILDKSFKPWIGEFLDFCKLLNLPTGSSAQLVDALNRCALNCDIAGVSDRAFIRAAMFRMLHHHCKQNNQKLIDLIVNYIPPP